MGKGQGGKIQKSRDRLRNKISALRSRMRSKRQQLESSEESEALNSKFAIILEILQEELVGTVGSKLAQKISRRFDKALDSQSV